MVPHVLYSNSCATRADRSTSTPAPKVLLTLVILHHIVVVIVQGGAPVGSSARHLTSHLLFLFAYFNFIRPQVLLEINPISGHKSILKDLAGGIEWGMMLDVYYDYSFIMNRLQFHQRFHHEKF